MSSNIYYSMLSGDYSQEDGANEEMLNTWLQVNGDLAIYVPTPAKSYAP